MKKILVGIVCLFAFSFGKAQTDDLIIVEYVDWNGGSGWAVKIFNPTNQSVNLSNYKITRYRDGDLAINSQAQISGTLGVNQFKVFGNSDYKSNCPTSTIQVSGINGTNSEDAVAITYGQNDVNIDMVGAYGVKTELTVDGVQDAIYRNKLVRNDDNCIRYFDLAGTTIHSWPDNAFTNVTTWTTFGSSCLSLDPVNFQIPVFQLNEDTTICNGEEVTFDFSNLNFDSYEWIGQNNQTASIMVTDSGVYTLEVGKNFCLVRDEIEVNVEDCEEDSIPLISVPLDSIYIPNIITPNNDGINDYFIINGFKEDIRLTFYNRWGRQIYQSLPYQNDWQAEGLNDGSYYYLIEEGFNQIKGWVEVKR